MKSIFGRTCPSCRKSIWPWAKEAKDWIISAGPKAVTYFCSWECVDIARQKRVKEAVKGGVIDRFGGLR